MQEDERARPSQWRGRHSHVGVIAFLDSTTGRMALTKVAHLRWGSPWKIQ